MNKKFKIFFLDSIEKERDKRTYQVNFNNKLSKLWKERVKKPHIQSKIELKKVIDVLNFAKNLNYTDAGSFKNLYFSHL